MIGRRVALAGLLAAPVALAQQPAPALVGPSWILREIGGATVPVGQVVSMAFTPEGRAQGSGGCNRFNGGYTASGATLRFGAIAGTMMACPPPLMDLEQRFHRALAEVRGWRIEAGALHLTGEDGVTLLRLTAGN